MAFAVPSFISSYIPTISSEFTADLEWSMEPLLLWMQICGVPATLSRSSTFRRKASLCVGIITMMWITISYIYLVYSLILDSSQRGLDISLHRYYRPLVNITITFLLIISTYLQWTSLWKIAIEMESRIGFDKACYQSLRKLSIASVTIMALVNILTIYTLMAIIRYHFIT